VIYVLHAFQKKSKTGIKTPQSDINLIAERLNVPKPITKVPKAQAILEDDMNNEDISHGTGNVYTDLGFHDATERQTKTRLAFTINELLKSRKLKQREVAELLGIPQPKVSSLKNYLLDNFSVERA
jgi:predicted XRE-type DNA-binding protein